MAKPHTSRAQQTWQEHPLVTALLVELAALEERRQYAVRLHTLMNQHGPLGIPVQYERLFFHAPAEQEENNDDPRSGTPKSHRRRVPPQRVGQHGHRRGGSKQRVLRMDTKR
jgi:hypothetical protein